MPFEFDEVFGAALAAGLGAAKHGGKAAQDWLRESAHANEETLRSIAEGLAIGEITWATAAGLLDENARALRAEAAALAAVVKSTAQAAVNDFLGTMQAALGAVLEPAHHSGRSA